ATCGGFDPQYAALVVRARCTALGSLRARVEEFEGDSVPEPFAPGEAGRAPGRCRKQRVIRGKRGPQGADRHRLEHRTRAARMVAVVVGHDQHVERGYPFAAEIG